MGNKTSIEIPLGIAKNALVSYLHTATLCTTDIEKYKRFYVDALKMQVTGPLEVSDAEKTDQKELWNIPSGIDYDLYHFYRAPVPSLIQMRVLHLKTQTPHIHKSYNAYELGSFSLGFPTTDAKAVDQRLQDFGIKAMAPTQIGDIVRADGVPGQYIETIYQGPDFLHVVGIERVGISPLAPCDPSDGFGGPGYSALVVRDTEAEMKFYKEVLGFYPLLDAVWETAEGSALGTGPGIPYRFTSLWQKDWEQNYVILLEFQDDRGIDTGVPSHLPNQGLGMYTFQTNDIEKVVETAKAINTKILSSIRPVKDTILGNGRACVMQTPSGFYYEFFEKTNRMDAVLKRFTEILCGTLDNQAQIDREQAAGQQIHPYAKHVTAICDHKVINRPLDHEGLYILEESYYVPPGKTEAEMELKPLLFYMRSDGKSKAFLQSVQIPEKFSKAEVTNDNEALIFDFNELTFRPFGTAEYSLMETDQFTVNHIGIIGPGMTFQLTETLSDYGLDVMELVRKDGIKLTPYDTPIEYRRIS